MGKESLIPTTTDQILGTYLGLRSRAEIEARERKARVIKLKWGRGVNIFPDRYNGRWHERELVDNGTRTMNSIYPKDQYDSYLIMSRDVLEKNIKLKEPGHHPRVILINEEEVSGINIPITMMKKNQISKFTSLTVGSSGETNLQVKNWFQGIKGDEYRESTKNEIESNGWRVYPVSLIPGKTTELCFSGGRVLLKRIGRQSMWVGIKK